MNTFQILLIVIFLFVGMLGFIELGLRLGKRGEDSAGKPFGPLSGAVFGLMGLLIAFTFSGAAARFEVRRQLIVSEVNAIEVAYMRIDLLPPAKQESMRKSFRAYVDARLVFYKDLGEAAENEAGLARVKEMQREIWSQAVAACDERGPNPSNSLILTSLNSMFDIATTREAALMMHPPGAVLFLLALLPLVCSLLAGFDAAGKGRSFLHMLGFALILTVTIYIILDYEYPRAGLFIHLDATNHLLTALRQSMNR